MFCYIAWVFHYAAAEIRYIAPRKRYADATLRYIAGHKRYISCHNRYAAREAGCGAGALGVDKGRFYHACGISRYDRHILLNRAGQRADVMGRMDMHPPSFQPRRRNPMSNTERQRLFRKRHPGYYQRLHAQRRAGLKEYAQQALAKVHAQIEAEAKAAVKPILMLPAPVELSVFELNLPIQQREAVPAEAQVDQA